MVDFIKYYFTKYLQPEDVKNSNSPFLFYIKGKREDFNTKMGSRSTLASTIFMQRGVTPLAGHDGLVLN
jgi:hypothetical protein